MTAFTIGTFIDLSQEHEGVLDAICRLNPHHDSMEFFEARVQQPIETCVRIQRQEALPRLDAGR